MPVPQNCQTVIVKSDKCCYKTTVETVVGTTNIDNVTFPELPNAYDNHIVQFDDALVIYEFFGGTWIVKLTHFGQVPINSIPSSAFVSATNPKLSEVVTWVGANLTGADSAFSILTYDYGDSRLGNINGQVYLIANNTVTKIEDLRESSGTNSVITLYVDPVSGSNTQNLELYLEGTARYLTLEQAFKDLIYVDKQMVFIVVENSTSVNPALCTTADVSGKVISISINNPGTGYLKFSGSTVFRNCNIHFELDGTLDFKDSAQVNLINSFGWIRRDGVTIELPLIANTALFRLMNAGLHIEDYAHALSPYVNIVFNSNDSALFVSDAATSNASFHGVNWINTGGYTNCKVVGYSTVNGGNHVAAFTNLSFTYSNDLADSNVYFGGPALVRVVRDYSPSDTSNDTACIFSTAGDELLPLNQWNKKCFKAESIIDTQFTLKAFLRGPYSGGTMTTTLATNTLIPVDEPYAGLGYERVHFGGESVSGTSVFTTNSITDWILVELRDKNNPELIKYNRAGLLKNNGSILDVDGVTPITFENIVKDSYYVSIRHRNHMGVMTADPVEITATGVTIDFSNPSTQLWGTDAAYNNSGVINLYGGKHSIRYGKYFGWNSLGSSVIKVLGYNISGELINVYNQLDTDLDGSVRYLTGVDEEFNELPSDVAQNFYMFSHPNQTYVERVPFWDRSEFEKQLSFSYKYDYFWSGTSGIKLPTGPDAVRPASPEAGTLRHSATSNKLEYYNGSWQTVASEPAYKVYRGLLTYTVFGVLSMIELENSNSYFTLGAMNAFSPGVAEINFSGTPLTASKTFVTIGLPDQPGFLDINLTTSKLTINCRTSGEVLQHGNLTECPIEILVYP